MASIFILPLAFGSATFLLYFMSINLPTIDKVDGLNSTTNTSLRFPSSLEDLTSLVSTLSLYKESHAAYILLLFTTAYIYKQTFAIPGSVFLNLLGGALYGLWVGFPLTCVLSASGATNCYLLSHFCGKKYLVRYFPDRIKPLQQKVDENRDSLFFFLLFLRLFPMSPNWFMNMVAPILNVPLGQFFLSVFVGLMPYNFICVQTGCILSQVTSVSDMFTLATSLKMAAMATAALLPGVVLKKIQKNRREKVA